MDGIKNNIWILILGIIFLVPSTLVIGSVGENFLVLSFIIAFPVVLLFVFNHRMIYSTIILLLFVSFRVIGFDWAVLFIPILVVSFILNFKQIDLKSFKNPLVLPLFFFLIFCIPSLFFSEALFDSLYKMFNLVVFAIVVLLGVAAINDEKDFKTYVIVFLAGALLNALFLIIEGVITQRRTFGFSGVMYVDYVGIAFIIMVLLMLMLKDSSKIISAALAIVFFIASIFTQTRNSWLTMFFTFLILILYLIKNSSFFEISRKGLVFILILSLFSLGVGIFLIQAVRPAVFERTEEFLQSKKEILTEKGEVTSSLTSRFFIWHTSVNAFLANPLTGVGIYAFPYVSHRYNTLPGFLFESYVEYRTPHSAYLAILTETGIIGMFGFLIFIFFMLKVSLSTAKKAKRSEEKLIALVLTGPIIYISISLLMTDAWLWDRGIISWGIFLGMNLSYRNFLSKGNSEYNTDTV